MPDQEAGAVVPLEPGRDIRPERPDLLGTSARVDAVLRCPHSCLLLRVDDLLADYLRAELLSSGRWVCYEGHVVHAPDLYDGKTFTDLNEGVGYAHEVGFGTIQERGRLAADGLPNKLVYAGLSLGALPAHMLDQRH